MDSEPILITAASSKTGRQALAALVRRGARARVLVRRGEAGEELRAAGAAEVVVGDLFDRDVLGKAMQGARQVLHICPPMHPQEDALAKTAIELCREAAVSRLVLYSVLHPLLLDVPHHRRKLEAERALVESGLPYVVLQPSRYMQHLLPIWKTVKETGVHSMPFDVAQRFSVVDLADLAEVAAKVLTEPGHDNATYPLAGPAALSQTDMAQTLSELLGKPVRAVEKPLEDFRKEATAAGMPAARVDTMCTMLQHYGAHGLTGNPNILTWLLGRPPTTFRAFVQRDMLK